MDAREIKALGIAARCRIVRDGAFWIVPSQSGAGRYRVDPTLPSCDCPDFALIGPKPCKHVLATRYVAEREPASVATTGQVCTTEVATGSVPTRKTYRQDWPAYDLAQTREKGHFQTLLADLCSGLPEPPPKGGVKGGRPTVPVRDAAFAAVFKVYCGMSARRFTCDLADAADRGHMHKSIGYSAVSKALESEALTPILHDLIRQSATPLAEVEKDFATDSSGFCTTRYTRWLDVKYGVPRAEHDWVKAHICTGVKTNVVTAVEIHNRNTNDCNILPSLTATTARDFTINEMSADKAYAANPNFEAVAKHGGTLYTTFRSNTTGGVGGLYEKMFHLFCLNRDEYLAHYHKRSNVESTFSAVKRKFGEGVRSKTDTAQRNEVLCKFVCQNVCCLIHAVYELGLTPRFWGRDGEEARTIIKFPGVG